MTDSRQIPDMMRPRCRSLVFYRIVTEEYHRPQVIFTKISSRLPPERLHTRSIPSWSSSSSTAARACPVCMRRERTLIAPRSPPRPRPQIRGDSLGGSTRASFRDLHFHSVLVASSVLGRSTVASAPFVMACRYDDGRIDARAASPH